MTTEKTNADDGAMDWDTPLEDTDGYKLIPKGPGTFEVLDFSRARKQKGKLGECNVAVLKLLVEHTESGETSTFEEDLTLHRKLQFLILYFFAAIGQRKHGDEGPFVPDWSPKKIIGSTGLCEIGIRTWEKKGGGTGSKNQIDKWVAPKSEDDGEELAF